MASVNDILVWQPLWIVLFGVGFVWSLGYYGFGFWWSLWAVPLFFAWQKLQHDRILRRKIFEYEKLQKTNTETLRESAKWMNKCIQNIWFTSEEFITSTVISEATTLFENNKPSMVHELSLKNVKIGRKCPTLSEVIVHDVAPDQFHFDAQFQLYSEMSMELEAKLGLTKFPVLVRDVFIKSQIRIHAWLIPQPPFISHVQISFVGEPVIDMIVKLIKIGPDVMSIPGLSAAIKKMMCDIIHQLFVYPNFYEYVLAPNEFVRRPGDAELLEEVLPNGAVAPTMQRGVNLDGISTAAALEAGLIQGLLFLRQLAFCY
uniref:SMP-LTD domain-containing protein n=1 Tax=Vannella robusta TaxID=1487602 RepID=A0A7S4IBY3_9EUKA|mmetsp:Transcript_234/g.299  ORF Transcript_234/g.299 Transcript_234/m.299 type:complete len:316 (+) Transcript_234:16-963(+)